MTGWRCAYPTRQVGAGPCCTPLYCHTHDGTELWVTCRNAWHKHTHHLCCCQYSCLHLPHVAEPRPLRPLQAEEVVPRALHLLPPRLDWLTPAGSPATPADDEDNFVVGLGVDRTSTEVPVVHPTDPNAPDLPPQPVLLVGAAAAAVAAAAALSAATAAAAAAAAHPAGGCCRRCRCHCPPCCRQSLAACGCRRWLALLLVLCRPQPLVGAELRL